MCSCGDPWPQPWQWRMLGQVLLSLLLLPAASLHEKLDTVPKRITSSVITLVGNVVKRHVVPDPLEDIDTRHVGDMSRHDIRHVGDMGLMSAPK